MRQDQTTGDPETWHDRAVDLLERFDHSGQSSDLESAIGLLRRVVDAIPADEPNRAQTLFNLGSAYLRRFDTVTNAQEDLKEAIAFLREGAPALTTRFPDRVDPLDVLVVALHSWFELTGDRHTMDEAAEVSWRACRATAERDPLYVTRLFMLAQAMNLRAAGRDWQDADQAVEVSRRLVAAPADRSVTSNIRLHLLAGALMTRAMVAHQLDDARESIQLFAEAARSAKKRDPQRWEHLAASIVAYRAYLDMGWWDEADRLTLAEGAIRAARDAVKAAPGRSERAEAGALLVEALLERSLAHSGSDTAEAIRVAHAAVQDSRGDGELHPEALLQLGNALHLRFKQTQSRADIDESVSILRQAAGLEAEHVGFLGNSLRTRFEHFGQAPDAAEAIELYHRISTSPGVSASDRVNAARDWGDLAAAAGDKEKAVAGYTAAVRLLPMLAEHGAEQALREHRVSQQRGLARDAAEMALDTGRPELAVELLEQGRSVLWSQALRLRTDLSALGRVAPDLAARLEQIRLDLAEDATRVAMAAVPGNPEARRTRVPGRLRQLSKEWDSLVSEARNLPGFDNFLAPPTFAELRSAASRGPVVLINYGKRRCDALAVTSQGVVPIPLPTARDAEEQADTWLTAQVEAETMGGASGPAHAQEALKGLLNWLWQHVTGPILEALGYVSAPSDRARRPRIWWCPTGLLASLPLHASGGVPDRVVSSYTPTLGHLLRARGQPAPAAPRVLAVGMRDTPGQSRLPAVPRELEMIDQALAVASGQGIDARLIGQKAHRSAVLGALKTHEWAHLACHGDQDWFQPGKGALYLHDGKLTVQEIGAQQAPKADLAFLSACRTAEGGVNLDDEGLTLATALHVSGYRHVVATLWPIRDDVAPTVARAFYEGITGSGRRDANRAGEALHQALDGIRATYPDDPFLWAPYVHIGP